MGDDLSSRLEMLLVLRWLDRPDRTGQPIALSLDDAAAELDLPENRATRLELLGALGSLEERSAIALEWAAEPGAGRTALVTLSPELRADARDLFGRRAHDED